MSRVGTALKATAIQQVFELAAMLLSLVLVPVYLSRLGQEGYGLFLTAVAWASYLMFANGGLSAATLILVSQARGVGDEAAVAKIVRTARALMFLATLLVGAISLGMYGALRTEAVASALKLTHPDAPLLAVMVGAQAAASLMSSTYYDLLIGVGRVQHVSFIQGATRLAIQLLTLLFLLLSLPVWAVFAASPLCLAVAGVLTAVLSRRWEPQAFTAGPWLERAQVVTQLRAGAKSLGLHVGATLFNTAPLFALTAVGGPALVPLYAVPNRVLFLAASAMLSFNALMTPAFGEAWARRDLAWLRETARNLLRQTLAVAVGIGAALIALGPPFVRAWTAGRLDVSTTMVAGIALAGGMQTLVGVMKFMLSGMNRHRAAAASELVSGGLAFLFCWAAVRFISSEAVAFGMLAAALVTSAIIMPLELRRYLEDRVAPRFTQVLLIAGLGIAVYAFGRAVLRGLETFALPELFSLAVAGATCGLLFVAICQLGGLLDLLTPLRRLRSRFG